MHINSLRWSERKEKSPRGERRVKEVENELLPHKSCASINNSLNRKMCPSTSCGSCRLCPTGLREAGSMLLFHVDRPDTSKSRKRRTKAAPPCIRVKHTQT